MTRSLSTIALPERRLPAFRDGIPPSPQRTAALTAYLHNNLETMPGNFRRYALSAAHEPSAEHRAMLMERRAEIDDGLVGADDITIRERVGALRAVMASASAGAETVAIARQAFIAVLQRYPAWAVTEACTRFLDGRSGNKVYAPTPAEIAEVCRTLVAEPLTERARINAILDAEVYQAPTEADRAEVARRHQAFVEETARAAAMRRTQEGDTRPRGDAADREAAKRDLARRRSEVEAETAAAAAEARESVAPTAP
ncbi:hypothetical protein G3T14_21425 [Methylobacterium sp. BTF04]|uniref:hypothetical protein n=1 Tax=Methylobacterium sp. BTF04 TaxID=2708300 RepID=UPI0013D04D15|nr:hypothetical protein [Methylobacterium sp. BTF04]NEU14648.1 hypothetical protein [Methylobacterium sp. BTF04]